MVNIASTRTDARRNLSLRRALDRARDALSRRQLDVALRSILKAGEQGPLPVRPTRLLWEVAFRWMTAARKLHGTPLDPLFNSARAAGEIDAGGELYRRGRLELALKRYRNALAECPLSPEAVYRTGLVCTDQGDLTEAALWLKLVTDILDGERRKGPMARGIVSGAYLGLAKIELSRGHRSRAATLALKALDVKPDFTAARTFIWDMERAVGNQALSPQQRD